MKAILLGLCFVLLAGCGRSPEEPARADVHATLQAEMEKGGMDFSRVLVVRLLQDGKRLEVSSVLPVVVAETQVRGQAAKTIFRVNGKYDGLTLFSRDVPKGTSYKTELALADLTAKKQFSFPVVQADGSLKEQSFALERIVTQP